MSKIHRFPTEEAWVASSAAWIAEALERALSAGNTATLALAGGATPTPVYRRLSGMLKSLSRLDGLHVFWGDERCVPEADPRSNAGMGKRELLTDLSLPQENVHPIDGGLAPEASAAAYQSVLRPFVEAGGAALDVVLLGLGEDGHTASLFPGGGWVDAGDRWVVPVPAADDRLARVSLTPALINCAGRVAFLVRGASKAPAVRSVMIGAHDPSKWPAQAIAPRPGELHWFLDEAAAAEL